VSEVDLPALEESLALLDRLDRRQGKPTPTPVRPIIYEGGVISYTEKNPHLCFCEGCDKGIFSAEIYMEADGTITGKLGKISFAGTVNSVVGVAHYPREKDDDCSDQEGINQDTQ
jgi:hypothetical protein